MNQEELKLQIEKQLTDALQPLHEELAALKAPASKQPEQKAPANPETEKQKLIAALDAEIAALDKSFVEVDIKQGNQAEIYDQVAKRAYNQTSYESKRSRLVKLRNELEGPSPAVQNFLKGETKVESKFDVEAGKAKIDNSLFPLGGRSI